MNVRHRPADLLRPSHGGHDFSQHGVTPFSTPQSLALGNALSLEQTQGEKLVTLKEAEFKYNLKHILTKRDDDKLEAFERQKLELKEAQG